MRERGEGRGERERERECPYLPEAVAVALAVHLVS